MNASNDKSLLRRLRGWWMSPPRPGLQILINPWEYRHLRIFGGMRITGGCIAAGAGLICLGYSAWAWGAFFLAIAALNFLGGFWYLSVANSAPAQA